MKLNKTLSLLTLVTAFTISCSTATAEGYGNYSNGVRVGMVEKFGIKGWINKSGEGYLKLGLNSTEAVKLDDEGKVEKTLNPWHFSVHKDKKDLIKRIGDAQGTYKVMHYKQSHFKSPISSDTEYEIKKMTDIQAPVTKACIAEDFIKGSKSNSSVVGRIVKASSKGTTTNSYEIMIQIGDSGGNFKEMSITSKAMYDCVMGFAIAGQRAKIVYSESVVNLSILSRETSYDIVEVSPISKSSGMN